MKSGLRLGASAVVLALAGVSPSWAQNRTEFVAKLHDGRFEAARRVLEAKGPLTSPQDLFFDAFATYWLLVFDDDNKDLKQRLDTQLDAVIRAAEAADPASPDDPTLWAGSGHLLLAELRASQRRPMSAAFEAKKAKKLLETATANAHDVPDALFGLGTYNYMADAVPSYVKGLRALLFLPKGNRTLGLNQLQTAAANSPLFALEARSFLITIYSSKHERQYGRALEERDRLLAAYPDVVAACYASARLDISLGRYDSALRQIARADERIKALGDVDPVVVRNVELLRARAQLGGLRPDLAVATASRSLAERDGVGPGLEEDFKNVREPAARMAAGVPWPSQARPAGGQADDFASLAETHPDVPIFALLAGNARLAAGKGQEALEWYGKAEKAGLSPDLTAICQFREGNAEDLLGRRDRAVELYKRAASAQGFFLSRDGAYFHQQTPYGPTP